MLVEELSSSEEEEGRSNTTLEISPVPAASGSGVGEHSPPSLISPRSSTWRPITSAGGTLRREDTGFDYIFVSGNLGLLTPTEEREGRGRGKGWCRWRGGQGRCRRGGRGEEH